MNCADGSIVPLFPVPNFPSYPSNHATFSTTRSETLAYLFPVHADEIRSIGKEGGDSRIWAGTHYQIDLDSGASGWEIGPRQVHSLGRALGGGWPLFYRLPGRSNWHARSESVGSSGVSSFSTAPLRHNAVGLNPDAKTLGRFHCD